MKSFVQVTSNDIYLARQIYRQTDFSEEKRTKGHTERQKDNKTKRQKDKKTKGQKYKKVII